MEQRCIILAGNIGCGKSTVAQWLMDNHPNEKIVTICNDGITLMCHNGYYQDYQLSLTPMYKDMFKRCLCAAIDAGCTVICDNLHETEKKRREIFAIAKAADMQVIGIDLGPGDNDTLTRRILADDGRETPADTWRYVHKRVQERYEPMNYEEGFDEIISKELMEATLNE